LKHGAWIAAAAVALTALFAYQPPVRAQQDEISPEFKNYDFTLKSLDGVSKVRLGSLIKKNYVVLVFWSARCPLCDFAMPYVAMYDDLLTEKEIKDVKLLTVALDARAEDPLKVAIAEKYAFEILHDPLARDTNEPYLLEKKGIPACYIFNKRGYIIATIYGFDKNFMNDVQEAINADRQSYGGAHSRPNRIVE